MGIDPQELTEDDLMRELESLHGTRNRIMRFGTDEAWEHHRQRTDELEQEFVRRWPHREQEKGTHPAAESPLLTPPVD